MRREERERIRPDTVLAYLRSRTRTHFNNQNNQLHRHMHTHAHTRRPNTSITRARRRVFSESHALFIMRALAQAAVSSHTQPGNSELEYNAAVARLPHGRHLSCSHTHIHTLLYFPKQDQLMISTIYEEVTQLYSPAKAFLFQSISSRRKVLYLILFQLHKCSLFVFFFRHNWKCTYNLLMFYIHILVGRIIISPCLYLYFVCIL